MKTIQELNPSTDDLLKLKYNYQPLLTTKLDNINTDFDQEVINEIVLWKINRYVQLTHQTLDLLNEIDSKSEIIDPELTKILLTRLLQTNGIRLPMASTILRFKNPQIYQIIDQRVYRVIYGYELRLKTNTEVIITQYMDYLSELRKVCDRHQVLFSESDRVLYEYDKMVNLEKIKY